MSILFKDLNNTLADIKDEPCHKLYTGKSFFYQKIMLTPCGQPFPPFSPTTFPKIAHYRNKKRGYNQIAYAQIKKKNILKYKTLLKQIISLHPGEFDVCMSVKLIVQPLIFKLSEI